ncbi:murein biosynthesis integral membrane protein MurJ [Brevibacterium sp. SMBL_HHYL_HB1]|uniref:murein biosynthesis integral membrane protein MurJ n=1 Tax=Brevibacterium sp. SMBL_HHYL_HB1 TaxID=2777556 RepID=UPI001BA770A7|nr:murein biosynthesis integral membrane protein MurJ [Brevibacterium sp. SMBL_HHYL_HB1]QUL78956.1 murein biosynthesis integral membrane protein MurJ [Brevibacterium sp. SMBL_HHYL_HB1]
MSSFSSLAKSSAIMTAGTLTSRVLGLVKASLLATAIGVTAVQADAFDIANKVPNTLYMLLAGGVVNAVLVPQIVRASKREDGGEDFTNRLLTLSFMILAAVSVLATLAAPLLVWLYSSGWSPEQMALATAFAYWCLPQLFFYGLYTLLGQVLNAKSSFGPYMWAPVLNNIVAIGGLAVFILIFGTNNASPHELSTWTPDKIALIAGTATLGVAAQALILIWPLKRIGFKYKPTFGFRGVGLASAGKVAFWTFAAMLIGQLGFLVISRVASGASVPGDGNASNAAYTNAYLVFMLPHSLIAVSLATALFTSLAKDAAEKDTAAVIGDFSMGVRMVGLINAFATAALIVLASPVAMVIAGTGREQAMAIGLVIITMVFGLVPFSANYLAQRVFYAYEDAKTPFFIQLPQIIFQSLAVLSASIFPKSVTVAIIGLVMSLGYLFAMILSFSILKKRLGEIDLKEILTAHLKFLLAAIVAGGAGCGLLYFFPDFALAGRWQAFATTALVGSVMLVFFIGACYLLRARELHSIIDVVAGKLRRAA